MSLKIIGIDADDTLWHTETVFRLTHKRFNELLGEFAEEGLLGGQRAIPAALEAAGYEFRHNTVGEALAYVTSTVES
jgi:NAD dependent epimerase/dehydratase family enzyme